MRQSARGSKGTRRVSRVPFMRRQSRAGAGRAVPPLLPTACLKERTFGRHRRWSVRVPTVQWRAVLLPAGVAIGAILVLAWYNFLWIPAQQRYLNERNLRVLRTISAQIKSKVDNFDQAIDKAIDSTENPDKESLGAYVQLFAPDLEILQFARMGRRARPVPQSSPAVLSGCSSSW